MTSLKIQMTTSESQMTKIDWLGILGNKLSEFPVSESTSKCWSVFPSTLYTFEYLLLYRKIVLYMNCLANTCYTSRSPSLLKIN